MKSWLFIRFLFIHWYLRGFNCNIVVKPLNTVVVTRSSTTLSCSSTGGSSSIVWQLSELSGANPFVVLGCVVQAAYTSQYSVVNDSVGHCDLVVKNVSSSQCGLYLCADGLPPDGYAYAYLTQIDSDPDCQPKYINNSTLGEVVPMSCRMDYVSVNPAMTPNMTWTGSGCGPSTISITSSSVVSSINVTAQLPTLSTCKCTTHFNAPSPPNSYTSTNVPEYNNTWTSPPSVIVYSCPINVIISPPGGRFYQWKNFSCSYVGYPMNAVFEWVVETDNETIIANSSESFNLSTIGNYRLTCTPINFLLGGTEGACRGSSATVNGSIYEGVEETTTTPGFKPTTCCTSNQDNSTNEIFSVGVIVGITVACLVAVVAAVAIIVYFLYKNNLVCFKPTNAGLKSVNQGNHELANSTSKLPSQDDSQNAQMDSQEQPTHIPLNETHQHTPDGFHLSQQGPQPLTDSGKGVYADFPVITVPTIAGRQPTAYQDPSNVYGQVNRA